MLTSGHKIDSVIDSNLRYKVDSLLNSRISQIVWYDVRKSISREIDLDMKSKIRRRTEDIIGISVMDATRVRSRKVYKVKRILYAITWAVTNVVSCLSMAGIIFWVLVVVLGDTRLNSIQGWSIMLAVVLFMVAWSYVTIKIADKICNKIFKI